ncbi:MAG TPA: hypothetical protein VMF69_18050 [Gemmataceae bacterium]|nr:hypothetical protein [Gemmataceae bacterium]
MEGDPGEGIYRAMIEENGMPRLFASATALGIRKDKDIVADQADRVHRPAFQPRGKNGLSCSRTIESLPNFALPVEWGGLNPKTVVWQIDETDLGAELIAQDDAIPGRNRHVSIGPATTMAYDDFARAIEATRTRWKKVLKS